MTELASGVDALYLSGKTALGPALIARLEDSRADAIALDARPPVQFGALSFSMEPHGWGKYRYCLTHPYLRLGLTDKLGIPAIRVQPRAEFLHGVGARAAAHTIADLLEGECGAVRLVVSRIDLFADVQGWEIDGDERRNFVTRATARRTFEEGDAFTGLQFGSRSTGTASGRIYDKTRDIVRTGAEFWKDIWGNELDPDHPVLRVEFELSRSALREFGLTTPDEVLDATGSLWTYCTLEWLTLRVPTGDATRSRWPLAPEWEAIHRASIGEGSIGITRAYKGQQRGEMGKSFPGLVGHLARFGALGDCYSQAELLEVLGDFLNRYQKLTGLSMDHRIWKKRRELGLL